MSASKEIKTLGVLAGAGVLPERLVLACEAQDIEPFVVGFEGQTDPALVQGRSHLWTRLGAAGKVIAALRSHGIEDLVLIGAVRRPGLAELRPDLKTAEFFARIGVRALGDNGLLSALRRFLEDEGFRVHGVQDFAGDLLAPAGVLGRYEPKTSDWPDIVRGLEVSQALGVLDVGQAAIIQQGIVLGVEGVEGTDALIERCARLQRKGRGGVLVKTCKPQQDQDLDLPTIGPQTILNARDAGLIGVVLHAGRALVIEPEEIAAIADKAKMFVVGVDPKDYL